MADEDRCTPWHTSTNRILIDPEKYLENVDDNDKENSL